MVGHSSFLGPAGYSHRAQARSSPSGLPARSGTRQTRRGIIQPARAEQDRRRHRRHADRRAIWLTGPEPCWLRPGGPPTPRSPRKRSRPTGSWPPPARTGTATTSPPPCPTSASGTRSWAAPADALPVTEEAVAIRRELAAAYPDRYRHDLAISLSNLGNRFSELGRPADALPAEQEAVTIRRELAAAYPDRHRPDLATSLTDLAITFSELGRDREAAAASAEADRYRGPPAGS